MFSIIGLICLIVGLIVGIFDVKIAMGALEWFVAAIGFNTVDVVLPTLGRKA